LDFVITPALIRQQRALIHSVKVCAKRYSECN